MKILELLKRYQPTEEEKSAYEQILAFVHAYPTSCFDRTLEVGHVTGSAWLLSRDATSVLLTHHTKLNLWCQLGGHCDGNPDVLQTALREAQEESGIDSIVAVSEEIFDLDVHVIPDKGKEKAHLHYDVRFLLQVVSDEAFVISPESKKLQWFGKNITEMPTQQRSILRMHEKWLFEDLVNDGKYRMRR